MGRATYDGRLGAGDERRATDGGRLTAGDLTTGKAGPLACGGVLRSIGDGGFSALDSRLSTLDPRHSTLKRTMKRNLSLSVLSGLVLAAPLTAQGPAPVATDAAAMAALEFRSIGPAVISGRISDIDVAMIPGEEPGRVIYIASAGGGVWKSENAGISWTPIFDDQPVQSIGDVTVAPSNPDIVWVGSGESNNLRSSSWGNGVYKSTDGGQTFQMLGLPTSQHVPRIVIHPTNPDLVFVAAMGPLWTSGGERGLYRTRDGGRTWERVLYVNETTGITDVVFDPANPEVMYAAAMQRERKAYSFVAGGPGSGIFKSTDGGTTWQRIEIGLPSGEKGRIGIDVSRSQPRTLYAYVHAQEGGVFRSDDGGESWTRQSNLSSLPWFTGQVRADPSIPDRVYHLGQQLSVSNDGGRTWERIAQTTHVDHHALWIDPTDSDHVMIGNDGGFYISRDGAQSWDYAENLPVSTFYAIGVDMREPYWVYGGLQDNGSWGAPSRTRTRSGIGNTDWVNVGGGDGFYTQIDPSDPLTMYAESQNGALSRVDVPTGERKSIRPRAEDDRPLRWNWSVPVVISRYDHNVLYVGANYLFRSPDRGDSWTRISEDMTRALDRDTLPIMGFRAAGGLGRHDGTAPYGNITTISESPLRRGLLYVGSDDGVINVTRDDGATWTRIERFAGVPDLTYVSRVEASHHDEGTVYATFDGHRSNDFEPYVLKSTDYGRTWTSIAGNLPESGSVQVVREHPRNPHLLFVGTEFGLYGTTDGGATWARVGNELPYVSVHDLAIHPRDNDLVIGTHGRGMYILHDLTPFERLADAQRSQATIFEPPAATIFNLAPGPGSPGDREYFAPNPPNGAMVSYWIGDVGAGRASLVITDATGAVVRELTAENSTGLHRTAWDLRWESPAAAAAGPRAADPDDDDPPFRGPAGPYVAAGEYGIELRVTPENGSPRTVASSRVTVQRDPLVRLTVAQFEELEDYRVRAYAVQKEANALVRELESAQRRLEQASGPDTTRISEARAAVDAALEAIRGRQQRGGFGGGFGGGGGGILGSVNGVANVIGSTHFAVTAEQKEAIEQARADLESQRPAVQRALEAASSAAGS